MVGIRQFRKLKSNVEIDEILCKKIDKSNAVSVCIADLAINCQDIADNAAIDISPFKTDVPTQPKPPFTLTVIGGNNSRARCFQFACFQPQGCGAVVKMIQLRLRSSFFMNMAPAPELIFFM